MILNCKISNHQQTHPKQTQGSDIHCGTSLDQLHANKFGQETILPSLQLCIEPTDKGGGCDYNYSCSYTDCISWKSPTEPKGTESFDQALRFATEKGWINWKIEMKQTF